MYSTMCYDYYGNPITHLTQWDKNISLHITDLDIPSSVMCHICNEGSATAMLVAPENITNGISVSIPNILLQDTKAIIVYLYLYGEDNSKRTIHAIRLAVTPKPQPDEYEYEDNVDPIDVPAIDAKIRDLYSITSNLSSSIATINSNIAQSTGTITYQENWGAYVDQSTDQTPVLKKFGNVVNFHGAFAFSGTEFTSGTTYVPICTLPVGFRPPTMINSINQGNGTDIWLMRITAGGVVNVARYRGEDGAYKNINSSSWLAFDTTWIV